MNRHRHPLILAVNPGRLRKYEGSVELVHSLLAPPTAHGNPENDHLRGEGLIKKKEKQFS